MTTTPTLDRAAQTANLIDAGVSKNGQFEPQVVALDSGRFVVLWTDNSDLAPGDTGGDDILAQVFDAFGNPVGAIQRVNNVLSGNDEGGFSVAALSGDKFVIAFEDSDIDGVSIRATEVTVAANNSMTFANRTIMADPGDDTLGDPAVSARADGSYMVVYSRTTPNPDTTMDVFGKVVSAGGVVGSEFSVLTGSDDVGTPHNDIATLTNGTFATVHAHMVNPDGDRGAFMRIFDGAGASVLAQTEVATTSGDSFSDLTPNVAALAGGGYVVAWSSSELGIETNVLFRIYNAAGTEVGSGEVEAGSTGDNNNQPDVIGLPDGGFVIVYDDDQDNTIKGQRFNASGGSVGSIFTIASYSGNNGAVAPAVSLTDDGRLMVVWWQFSVVNNIANNDVRLALYDPRDTTIDGDGADNTILARLNDNTTVNGLDGNDTLFGRNGDDTLNGGRGADSLSGGAGADTLNGEGGADEVSGGGGADSLKGGGGKDFVEGKGGGDILDGGGGNDTLSGGGGDDTLSGGKHADSLKGGNHNDELWGNGGADTLDGGARRDLLKGGGGGDELFGGKGRDTLQGGGGDDTLDGGPGNDTFIFKLGDDADTIVDFKAGAATNDVIDLVGFGSAFDSFAEVQAAASQVGADVVINFGGGDQITLLNTNLGDLHADDFLLG